jgi:HSP20 family protein
MLETPNTYIFRVELPGVGKESINIEITGNRLRIFGERPMESEPAIAAYHTIERIHGAFERTFTIPGLVDGDSAEAKYLDGLLEIVIPKVEQMRERRVSVVCPG